MIETFNGHSPVFKGKKYVHYTACVIGKVTCGRHVSIWPNAVVRGDDNQIVIGEHTNIQDGSVLHITQDLRCVVGDYVTIGHNVNLHACRIGSYSLIGIGSIVLDGAVVGENCVIAAGSVVPPNKVIPDNSLFLKGEIRPRETSKKAENKHHAEYYWNLAEQYIRTAEFI